MIKRFIGGFIFFVVIAMFSPFIALGFISTAIYEAFKLGTVIADAIVSAVKEVR